MLYTEQKQTHYIKSCLRPVCLALVSIMVISAAACSVNNDTSGISVNTSSGPTETAAETDSYGREVIAGALPEGLKFNGETVTVFLREAASIFDTRGEFIAEAANGEVVNDAVYKRNLEIEDTLNVQLAYQIAPGSDYSVYANMLRKSHMAGDKAYDIYAMYAYFCVELATGSLMYNLNTLPYLDLGKPWWNQNFIDEITLNDRLFYIVGDISLTATQCTNAMFFNKQLIASYFGDLNLYETVYDGKWTIDYFNNLIKGTYVDVNGDSVHDNGDKYGVALHAVSIPMDAYMDAFDLHITEKDQEGIPRLAYKNERSISAFEKLYSLMFENDSVLFGPSTLENYYDVQTKFGNSESIFLIDIYMAAEKLRNMTDDYGVLPIFKYDEAQEGYYTNTADIYSLFGIAAGTKDPEVTGAVFELLGELSYDYVTPAYFEIALKQKYARDNEDAVMYDMVLAGNRFNFGFVYSACMGNMIHLWRGLLGSQNKNFVSGYDGIESSCVAQLDKLIKAYAEMQP